MPFTLTKGVIWVQESLHLLTQVPSVGVAQEEHCYGILLSAIQEVIEDGPLYRASTFHELGGVKRRAVRPTLLACGLPSTVLFPLMARVPAYSLLILSPFSVHAASNTCSNRAMTLGFVARFNTVTRSFVT